MDKAWFLLLSIKFSRMNFSGFFVSILSSLSRSYFEPYTRSAQVNWHKGTALNHLLDVLGLRAEVSAISG